MTTRPRILVTATLIAGVLVAGGAAGRQAAARVAADDTPTAIVSPTATAGFADAATPAGTDTPGFGNAPTPVAGTPTATPIVVKPIVHNPTPIVPPVRKRVTLPKPVVVEVATKTKATGLSQKQALLLANKYVPQLFVVAPTYVPKGYVLQMVHVDPAQDQQTPPAAWLLYVPKGLTKVGAAYPSFNVNKQQGISPIIYPGGRPQTVTINKGIKGVGVIKGTLIDLKPKNGYEVVHITWTRVSISYDVSSTVGISKLSVKDLLAVAATVQ
jgi:hypothetical protein